MKIGHTIIGLNAYHGDASASLLVDGKLIFAAEEERFRRLKHWAGFPSQAVRACLDHAGISASDVDAWAVARDPKAHLPRKLGYVLRHAPSLSLLSGRARNSLAIRDLPKRISQEFGLPARDVRARTHWVEHHPAHLASAFFASPFDDAAVCAIDGFGDFVSTSFAHGRGSDITVLDRVHFPHSLGIMYLAITQYLGFHNFGDEYKVMGLAPYGKPGRVDALRQLVHLKAKGRFVLDLSFFRHWSSGSDMTWNEGVPTLEPVFSAKLEELLGPARKPGEPVTSNHEDIARSLQAVHEECAMHVLRGLHDRVDSPRLALAGGCAMNSVANGKIRAQTPFKEVYIQPAAGDNGTSLGAALHVLHAKQQRKRSFVMDHGYWGPSFTAAQVENALDTRRSDLDAAKCKPQRLADHASVCDWTVQHIVSGGVVGWFQGRMEWGARALGNRSIVADPRRADMREIINTKIKFRERFRPFAPSILEESVHEYFEGAVADPFMIQVYPVREDKRAVIPAVTHVDGTGRLQTVHRTANPEYWTLIKTFEKATGVPIVLNTSFNENEPIVHTPDQAIDCFLRTKMDALVLGGHVLAKGR